MINNVDNVALTVTDNSSLSDRVFKLITILTYEGYVTDIEDKWNLMSVPYYENVSKVDILVDDTDWDTAVGNGWISDFIFGWNRPYQYYDFSNTFEPGQSYWLYAYQSCTLKRVV